MQLLSQTEENYLKAIYALTREGEETETSTNAIAEKVSTKPSTVTDMLRKLKEKSLIEYEKYKKVGLTRDGEKAALQIVRKHRLWEVFLYEKLAFSWDEVHEVAEQLEHIQSPKLIDRLDQYLGSPEFDPHGDPIPTANGELRKIYTVTLAETPVGNSCKVMAVKDGSTDFLKYLAQLKLELGTELKVIDHVPFDGSMIIQIGKSKKIMVSQKIAENIMVK